MSNTKYKLLKRQYSRNGVNWIDLNPLAYRVGDIVEEDSNCGGEEATQYRYVASDYFECDGTTKYQLAIKQYSTDGKIWNNVVPLETIRQGYVEDKSVDCGYEGFDYRWVHTDEYYCIETEDPTPPTPPTPTDCNTIHYTSIDENIVTPYSGLTPSSNTYENYLGTMIFDDCIEIIPTDAFYNRSSLTSVELPNTVETIGNYAFGACSGLTRIEIPNSVTTIGQGAFYFCTKLPNITIPSGVTSIGREAFRDCTNLTRIEIPSGVTSIGIGTFYSCFKLTTANIPSGVTSIGSSAFYQCTSLTSVNYNGTKTQWNAISKGTNWKLQVPTTCKVHCTDGDISI